MRRFIVKKSSSWVSGKLKYGLLIAGGFWLAWIGFLQWQAYQQPPSAIVVLGGGIRREMLAARLAQHYPNLPIIISSGSPLPCVYRVFVEEQGVAWQRVKVDFRATDTLTNFTSLLPYLQSNQPRKVFMISSKGNFQRASILAWFIWGSRGIATEPVLVDGVGNHESLLKTVADGMRAVVWVFLGEVTVANLYRSDAELQSEMSLRQSGCEIGSANMPEHI